jgi:hypothetical protein
MVKTFEHKTSPWRGSHEKLFRNDSANSRLFNVQPAKMPCTSIEAEGIGSNLGIVGSTSMEV